VSGQTQAAIATTAAQDVISALQQRLKSRLQEAMAAGGATAAIEACADEAQGLTVLVAAGKRARLGRASLRVRNPANQPPDWVQEWLESQGERHFDGVEGVVDVVETPDGSTARVIKPIRVEESCLSCHGADIDPGVAAILAVRYPQDAAIGYAVGDLRGAMWSEVPF